MRWQLRIAAGEALTFDQSGVERRGHALECRIYAEDPESNFMPSPGPVTFLNEPSGPGVRVDSGVYSGGRVPVHYDPMISKLSVWGEDRTHAIERMRAALAEYVVAGIVTNIAFHGEVLAHEEFLSGRYDTEFVPRMMKDRQAPENQHTEWAELAAALASHVRDEEVARGGSGDGAGAPAAATSSRWTTLARLEQGRSY